MELPGEACLRRFPGYLLRVSTGGETSGITRSSPLPASAEMERDRRGQSTLLPECHGKNASSLLPKGLDQLRSEERSTGRSLPRSTCVPHEPLQELPPVQLDLGRTREQHPYRWWQ